MTITVTPDVVALAAELVHVQSQMAALGERAEAVKDMLRELGKGRYDAGVYDITIIPNRRLDETKVAAAYPVETNAHLYKTVVNGPVVKALVEPAVYDAMLVEVGKAKVTVR